MAAERKFGGRSDTMVPRTRYILSYPTLHAIILFRQKFYPQHYSTVLDTTYLTYCAVFAVVAGLDFDRAAEAA